MVKKLLLVMSLNAMFCMQAMDTVSVLEINQKNIDATCAELVALDSRRKILRPLAIAAIVGGVGYGAKKLWWDAKDKQPVAQVDKALEGSGIANMSPESQKMLLLAMLTEREEQNRLQAEQIANRTYWEGAKKGIQDFGKWFKSTVPWTIGTGIAYAGISHAQNIVTDTLPIDTIVDNFTSSQSVAWYCANRTKYILAEAALLDKAEMLAQQMRSEERSAIIEALTQFDACFERGEVMADQEMEKYNELVARFEELNACMQLTQEQIDDLAQEIVLSCALYVREAEKLIGYLQYHQIVLKQAFAKNEHNGTINLSVEKSALAEKRIRAIVKNISKQIAEIALEKNASRTNILAIKNSFEGIKRELHVYKLIENK